MDEIQKMLRQLKRDHSDVNLSELKGMLSSMNDYLDKNVTKRGVRRLRNDLFSHPRIISHDHVYANVYFAREHLNDFFEILKSGHIKEESDIVALSKEFIYDLWDLNYHSGVNFLNLDGRITKPVTQWASMFYFKASWLGTNNYKTIPNLNVMNFDISIIPVFIRMALEMKIKEVIGYEKAYDSHNKESNITVHQILSVIKQNKRLNFFGEVIDVNDLLHVNRWANYFVHTGVSSYYWKYREAISILNPLFKEENGFNMQGRTFAVNFAGIKAELSKKYKKKVILVS
ncbi:MULTISPECIES: hypothetical protein [Enterobacteriaceae]|uniref:hypothetical protein n=1 Tax=Enterobacteriaceae TaxID=543 RepID=UPI000C3243E6|nr:MULTISPECIES: hypothetical protein [Enterobacteriaceae]ELY9248820.1 hypothetical protein [Salmonella enterica]PKH20027.1 hypothetical protein CIG19_19300 [Enterobacterales bacterium CwR94]HDJ1435573.1 hypothetical protein [Enterobacter asburiae]